MTNSAPVHSPTTKRFRFIKWLAIPAGIVVVAILALAIRFAWDIATAPPYRLNSLASDEELIAYFQTHRADIEELVKRYREYTRLDGQSHHTWLKQSDTMELFRRAGVKAIDYEGWTWLPNPYSVETAKQIDVGLGTPSFLEHHGAIRVRIDDVRFVHNSIWKDLCYIPVVPRIENGILLGPVDKLGRHLNNERVLPTLNNEPPDVLRDECALRQIEPQWFIHMCRVIY